MQRTEGLPSVTDDVVLITRLFVRQRTGHTHTHGWQQYREMVVCTKFDARRCDDRLEEQRPAACRCQGVENVL